MAWLVTGDSQVGLCIHPSAWHRGFPALGGLFHEMLCDISPTLRFYDLLPSPGTQWSVVANGRVSATPQQLLLWWLLSPVTLRPQGQ